MGLSDQNDSEKHLEMSEGQAIMLKNLVMTLQC